MVNWYNVLQALKKGCHIPDSVETIEEALDFLYRVRELSLMEIRDLTDREVLCPNTIRIKLAKSNIPIKGRGGAKATKDVPVTIDELKRFKVTQLARKYGVHEATIYNRRKKLLGGE